LILVIDGRLNALVEEQMQEDAGEMVLRLDGVK
jgi:hypothetical protein